MVSKQRKARRKESVARRRKRGWPKLGGGWSRKKLRWRWTRARAICCWEDQEKRPTPKEPHTMLLAVKRYLWTFHVLYRRPPSSLTPQLCPASPQQIWCISINFSYHRGHVPAPSSFAMDGRSWRHLNEVSVAKYRTLCHIKFDPAFVFFYYWSILSCASALYDMKLFLNVQVNQTICTFIFHLKLWTFDSRYFEIWRKIEAVVTSCVCTASPWLYSLIIRGTKLQVMWHNFRVDPKRCLWKIRFVTKHRLP